MTRKNLSELKEGMILKEDVYDSQGAVLIGTETLLEKNHIDFLKKNHIVSVLAESKTEYDLYKINRENQRDLEEKYRSTVDKFKEIYSSFKLGKVPLYQELSETIEPLYEAILNDDQFAQKMWQIKAYDGYTFEHSVRVSMIAGLLAKWYGMSETKIKEATLAGLLHDIGKCNIPDEILNKPGPLTPEEYKVIKTHATLGYILIKDIKNLSYEVLLGVLQHHERVDGTGYPNGLMGDQISEIAKVVAVSDVYCAMTANRVYKVAMHPFEVANFILDKCYSSLDLSMTKTFLGNISHYYIGHKVILNTAEEATVVMTYRDNPSRPLVRIKDDYYDLRRSTGIEIVSIIEEE